MRRTWFVIAALLLVAATGSVSWAAGNAPHFVKNLTSASLSGTNLVVNFKESGLQAGSTETITVSATTATTYECVNGGGKNPSASNKRTYVEQEAVSGQFTADQNGNIVGALTLAPPSATDLGFSCPPGQTVTFVAVTYSDITITDATSGATLALPGSFSYTNPDAP